MSSSMTILDRNGWISSSIAGLSFTLRIIRVLMVIFVLFLLRIGTNFEPASSQYDHVGAGVMALLCTTLIYTMVERLPQRLIYKVPLIVITLVLAFVSYFFIGFSYFKQVQPYDAVLAVRVTIFFMLITIVQVFVDVLTHILRGRKWRHSQSMVRGIIFEISSAFIIMAASFGIYWGLIQFQHIGSWIALPLILLAVICYFYQSMNVIMTRSTS